MLQTVLGRNFIPESGDMRGGVVSGDGLALSGSALLPPWAFAIYTAPFTPLMQPKRVTVHLDSIVGDYWLGLFDWAEMRWNYIQATQPVISYATDSAFWSIHVYGSNSLRVLFSIFETQP